MTAFARSPFWKFDVRNANASSPKQLFEGGAAQSFLITYVEGGEETHQRD